MTERLTARDKLLGAKVGLIAELSDHWLFHLDLPDGSVVCVVVSEIGQERRQEGGLPTIEKGTDNG